MSSSFATALAGVALEHPLLNAAGTARTAEEVRRLARSPVAAITVGSVTLAERAGQDGEVYLQAEHYSLNALGMPNRGAEHYRAALPELAALAHEQAKPLIVSVAGFDPDEYGALAELAGAGGADLVELNLGCPNVWDGGRQHRIASFDPDAVARAVDAAAAATATPIGVKLSPLSDPALLTEVAAAIAAGPARFVVSCNTFPNGLALRPDGAPALGVGFGGVSGAALKPIALGQVAQLRAALPEAVDIVGVGGVRRGADVEDLRRAGASAVGLATAYWNAGEDPRVFSDLLADWLA